MKKGLFMLLLLWAFPVHAQVGSCEPAMAEAYLDAGNVRARILNNGSLFWRRSPQQISSLGYEVPKGSGLHAMGTASLWVGGIMDAELRTAATRYGPWEFWAGPLDKAGNAPAHCKPYDHIWEIRTEDIQAFLNGEGTSENLKNWPWQLGAPVIDGDGNPDNYDLEHGDLPELLGDQRLWWIMNDAGGIHQATGSNAIGLEIQASAFAIKNPPWSHFTFYSYALINKNVSTLEDTYAGLFTNGDLGYFGDDYVGSDSLLHLGFYYNADNEDEGYRGYGDAPPAIGLTFLHTPIKDDDNRDNDRDGIIDEPGEMLGTTNTMAFDSDPGPYGDPTDADHYYAYMQSTWGNGRHVVEGYRGIQGDYWPKGLIAQHTNFFYPGDPVTGAFWSENNMDGMGNRVHPSDRLFVVATGPFNLAPGDTTVINFAIIWSRGDSNLNSISVLRRETRAVRANADYIYTPTAVMKSLANQQAPLLGFDQNFPNPFSQSTTLRYSLPQTMQVRLAVYDILGREVALLVDAQQEAGIYTAEFDADNLPAGIYLARIELDFLQFTKRMVLIR
ncbi:MAG: T9SS type A sorting domain-containing protein [Bacteroidota bacterium]